MIPEEPQAQRPPGLTDAQFWHYYRRYPYLLAKAALWGGVLYTVYWFLRNVESVALPVLISLLIAYLLDPAVDRAEHWIDRVPFFRKKEVSRTLAIFGLLIIILAAATGFVLVLYPALSDQVTNIFSRFPDFIALVQSDFIPWIERTFKYDVPASVSEAMSKYGESVQTQLPGMIRKATEWVGSFLAQTGAVVASLLNIVMIPLFTFYFLRDFGAMQKRLAALVPRARHEYYVARIEKMDDVVGEWFRGQVTVALILSGMYAAGLALVFGLSGLGVGTGIAIGVLSGLLNIIPYFGFLIGFILSVLMVVLDWGGFWPLAGVGIVFLVVQALEGYVITPRIVGDKVGLSPVVVIIVLLLGGELFGLLGVLLAIPVAGMIRVLLPDIIRYYETTPFFSGNYAADWAAAKGFRHSGTSLRTPVPAQTGLEEATDGVIDEPAEKAPAQKAVPDASTRRPVTASDARTTDRPETSGSPLDGGTDGDPEEDGEPESDAATKAPASDQEE